MKLIVCKRYHQYLVYETMKHSYGTVINVSVKINKYHTLQAEPT